MKSAVKTRLDIDLSDKSRYTFSSIVNG